MQSADRITGNGEIIWKARDSYVKSFFFGIICDSGLSVLYSMMKCIL
jgi:hypothetical protein